MSFKSLFKRKNSHHTPSSTGGPAPTKTNSQCHFLALPAELRNAIYIQTMYPHLPRIRIMHCSSAAHINRSIFDPTIFNLNRQIRTEAIALLCATMPFEAVGLNQATLLLRAVGESGRKSLRNLTLIYPRNVYAGNFNQEARFVALMRELLQLRRFTVVYASPSNDESADLVLKDLLGVLRDVLRERDDVEYLEVERAS